jgi:energy-converting hydrogenase A subunit C
MIEEIVIIIVIIMAIRALFTRNKAERMLYINVVSFGVAALIAFSVNTPFGLIMALIFFITSSIGSSAISYTLGRLDNEIILDNDGDGK